MLASIALLSTPVIYVLLAYCLGHAKQQILLIYCLATITISSIRWESGTDWDFYYSLYLNSFSYYIEKGYFLLSSISSNLGVPYNLFLAILALPWILLAYLPVARLKLNYQATCVYFVALYSLVFLTFIGGRQQIAIAMIVALMFARSLLSKILIVSIGVLFHSSFLFFSLVLYAVYFLNGGFKFIVNRVKQLSLLRKPLIYYSAALVLISVVISVFALGLPLFINIIAVFRPNYVYYFEYANLYVRDPSSQALRTALKMSFYILPPLIANLFAYRNKVVLTLPQDLRVLKFYSSPKSGALLVIAIFLFCLSTLNPNIGGRLELYLRPLLAIQVSLFASAYFKFNARSKFAWPILILIFGLLSKFILSLFADDFYLPYTTIFTN